MHSLHPIASVTGFTHLAHCLIAVAVDDKPRLSRQIQKKQHVT